MIPAICRRTEDTRPVNRSQPVGKRPVDAARRPLPVGEVLGALRSGWLVDFRLLGPLEVSDGETILPLAGGRQRALLAVLLLHANRTVSVERLIDDLWGDAVPDTAVKAVQIYVSRLRKVLPAERLLTRPPGYVIEVGEGELDLEPLRAVARRGAARADRGPSPETPPRCLARRLRSGAAPP